MHLHNQYALSFNPREMSSIHSLIVTPLILTLRVTLRLQEDNPSTHQKVHECKLMMKGQMEKTQHDNVLT
jgi:hypothetical protein